MPPKSWTWTPSSIGRGFLGSGPRNITSSTETIHLRPHRDCDPSNLQSCLINATRDHLDPICRRPQENWSLTTIICFFCRFVGCQCRRFDTSAVFGCTLPKRPIRYDMLPNNIIICLVGSSDDSLAVFGNDIFYPRNCSMFSFNYFPFYFVRANVPPPVVLHSVSWGMPRSRPHFFLFTLFPSVPCRSDSQTASRGPEKQSLGQMHSRKRLPISFSPHGPDMLFG